MTSAGQGDNAPKPGRAPALYTEIGMRIREARRAHGLTQQQLADRLGVGRTTITNIETGFQRILIEDLLVVARELMVSPTDLLPLKVFEGFDESDLFATMARRIRHLESRLRRIRALVTFDDEEETHAPEHPETAANRSPAD